MTRTIECLDASYPGLARKRVVVTGGASGIGLCLVQAFARQGAVVYGIDRDREAIARAGEEPACANISFIEADLSVAENVIACMESVTRSAPVDVLISNAANDTRHAWNEVTPTRWRATLRINPDHQFFSAQAVARGMVKAGSGVILLIGSVAARRGRPAMVGYLSAKSAIEGMTRGLARELGPHGVRVCGVVPGGIDTERQRRLWRTPEVEARLIADQALPVLLDGWDARPWRCFWRRTAAVAPPVRSMHSMPGFTEQIRNNTLGEADLVPRTTVGDVHPPASALTVGRFRAHPYSK
jgi:NAD(P)-dependent dehydrogenase (short-subunit alcohol dehydrogenase family)